MSFERFQTNKQIQAVLVQHGLDLSVLHFSFVGQTVYFSGRMEKAADNKLSPQEIIDCFTAVSRIPEVRAQRFDVDNWVVEMSGAGWYVACKEQGREPLGPDKTVYVRENQDDWSERVHQFKDSDDEDGHQDTD